MYTYSLNLTGKDQWRWRREFRVYCLLTARECWCASGRTEGLQGNTSISTPFNVYLSEKSDGFVEFLYNTKKVIIKL